MNNRDRSFSVIGVKAVSNPCGSVPPPNGSKLKVVFVPWGIKGFCELEVTSVKRELFGGNLWAIEGYAHVEGINIRACLWLRKRDQTWWMGFDVDDFHKIDGLSQSIKA